MSLFEVISNIEKMRTIFGHVILLTHHTRVFKLSSTFAAPNIRFRVGLFSLLSRSVFLMVIIVIFLLVARWLRSFGRLHRIDLRGLS